MFYKNSSISKHKRLCYYSLLTRGKGSDTVLICDPVKKDLNFLQPSFMKDVFDHLLNDEMKREISSDVELIYQNPSMILT